MIFDNTELVKLSILFITGIFTGITNTLAGGGSAITLPVLIFIGLPSPIANATNRVAIFFQNATATASFKKHNQLEIKPAIPLAIAAIFGSIIGSYTATKIDTASYDKILAIVMLFILVAILKPKSNKDENNLSIPKYLEIIIFLAIGFYGGFIQAGVGFIILAALNLIFDKNLIQANAIKVFIVGVYTIFALVIFALADKIVWKYGIALAAGKSLGAIIGVKLAIKKGEMVIKIILTIAILASFFKLFGLLKF